jgi:serine/threonine-protein kinase RsbW
MNVHEQRYTEDRREDLVSARAFASIEEAVRMGVEDVTALCVAFAGRTDEIDSHRLELKIANRLEEIRRVNEAINSFAERHGLDARTRRQLNVVFDELLNNVISYGYEDDSVHEIDVTVAVSGGRLYATIRDDGKPFNPFEVGAPETDLAVEDRPLGGLGVHLVRNVMDRVSYERRGADNVILLEKQLFPVKE